MELNAAVLCLLLTALLNPTAGQLSCSRETTTFPDCSTVNSQCRSLFNDSGMRVGRLPRIGQNSQTCFRTCFESDGDCQVTMSSVVEQKIEVDARNDEYVQRKIFSPQYSVDPEYIGSTLCRYRVDCERGEVLSYSIHNLSLEQQATCSGDPKCVDWVRIESDSYGFDSRPLCGTPNFRNIFFVGGEAVNIEFVTNRNIERAGFLLFVTCSKPGRPRPGTSDDDIMKRAASQSEECTFPSNAGWVQLAQTSPRQTLAREVETLLKRNYRVHRAVGMTDLVAYNPPVVTLYHTAQSTNEMFQGVQKFQLINWISRRQFKDRTPQSYRGFGHLIIVDGTAYFYQFGADCRFQPTPEESRIAYALEEGIIKAIGIQNNYDVGDLLDVLENSPKCYAGMRYYYQQDSCKDVSSGPQKHGSCVYNPQLDQLALRYGNACNGVLRAAACSYQEQVMRRDCLTGKRLFPFRN